MRVPSTLKGKRILLGVTGSIAAYKAVLLLRRLMEAGSEVTVVMTGSARKFVTPLTFEGLSGRKVYTDLFAEADSIQHLLLAEDVDLILVAPATANMLAKMANGVADDLLSTILLATQVPIVIAPAMDGGMWDNPIVQRNISILEGMGCVVVPPEHGLLASGKEGMGRLASEDLILSETGKRVIQVTDFVGETFLITAGPTREPLDPVRFISNRSSGKMGYSIARAAVDRGAKVILISGPTSLVPPAQAEILRVETTMEMKHAVMKVLPESSVVIMAAAVSDFRPKELYSEKIKKTRGEYRLDLEPTPDILKEIGFQEDPLGVRRLLVGFAAESGNPIPQAIVKLEQKGLDLIVANDISLEGAGFDSDTNIVTLIDRTGWTQSLPQQPKLQVAEHILNRIRDLLKRDPATSS